MAARSNLDLIEGSETKAAARKSLPHELIVDIISRLPAIDLWPLRYTCKSWLRLVTADPQFSKLHFDRSLALKSTPTSVIARHAESTNFYLVTDHKECNKAIPLDLPFLNNEESAESVPVYGICNGMLCLSHVEKDEVYIWNPLTKDHITIPYSPVTCKEKEKVITVFGFGYLQDTDEYKVIKLAGKFNWGKLKYRTQLSVYTPGVVSSWRIVAEDIPFGVTNEIVPCPQSNGCVYWLARKDGYMPVTTILAFNLKDESLFEIDHPAILPRADMTCIQELGGSLCLFKADNKKDVFAFAMNLNGESYSWSLKFIIEVSEVVGDFSTLIPLGVAHSGDVILLKNSKGLMTYNSDTKSINDLKEFEFLICNAHAYFGSIISPRVISGARQIMT